MIIHNIFVFIGLLNNYVNMKYTVNMKYIRNYQALQIKPADLGTDLAGLALLVQ